MGDGEEPESNMGQDRTKGVHAAVRSDNSARKEVLGKCGKSNGLALTRVRTDATDTWLGWSQDDRHVGEGKEPMAIIVIGNWGG